MGKQENLTRGRHFQTGDKATIDAGRRGGIASGAARRRKKAARDELRAILGGELPQTATMQQLKTQLGITEDNGVTPQSVILAQMVAKAAAGDVRAAAFIFSMLGEDSESKIAEKRLDVERQRIELLRDDVQRKRDAFNGVFNCEMPIIVNVRPDKADTDTKERGGDNGTD